jgi:CRP/FNR family cyclic AMP-dependent transcriptional regulator
MINNHEVSSEVLMERLRQHPYFQTLEDALLLDLANHATCYTFFPGEVIFLDGAPSAGMWLINEGQVKIYKLSSDGNEHILRLLGPGDTFNDIAALDGGPNPANAAAMSQATMCALSNETLMEAVQNSPDLALSLIRVLTQRTRFLVSQVENLAFYSVTTRLARFLLEQEENPALTGSAITRTAIAAHLAAKPETISRSLSQLERSGIVRLERARITVLRDDLLRTVAML